MLHERKQILAFVRGHPQRSRDALQDIGRDLNIASLLEPRVPGHTDAGERGDVLAAQARSAAPVGVGQAHLAGRQTRATSLQEVDELAPLRRRGGNSVQAGYPD
jgi:hypothetical protein